MNITKLYQDHSVYHASEGHKHCRPGWVQIECPFCTGNPGLHLGYSLTQNYFSCYRCGGHSKVEVIAKLLHIDTRDARAVIRKYGGRARTKAEPILQIRTKVHKLPSGTMPLGDNHKKYLSQRNFDPELLEQKWNLVGTGPISRLDNIDYKHRIIAPVFWNRKQVSFISRDITGKSTKKYMVCPKDREMIEHKHILYGKQEHWTKTGICVEGITDVWRFGLKACATFGIKYTPAQLRMIAKNFTRVDIVFDDEPQAQAQAIKLRNELLFRGVKAENIKIQGDPGDLDQIEADKIVKYILNGS